jgi:hypothetical protein
MIGGPEVAHAIVASHDLRSLKVPAHRGLEGWKGQARQRLKSVRIVGAPEYEVALDPENDYLSGSDRHDGNISGTALFSRFIATSLRSAATCLRFAAGRGAIWLSDDGWDAHSS